MSPASSPSRIALLTTATSLAGMLCLSLADLLPWPVFLGFTGIHVLVYRHFHADLPFRTSHAVLLALLLIGAESFRIAFVGRDGVLPALRDLIVFFALVRLILPKSSREIHQIVGISITECVLSTIFTESPLFLTGFLLTAFLVPMVLSALDEEHFGAEPGQAGDARHWPRVWAGLAATTCILFFIVPRPSSTLVKYGFVSRTATGFSENINLSQASAVEKDRSVVMRIVWDRGRAPESFHMAGARLDVLTGGGFVRGTDARLSSALSGPADDVLTVYPTGLDSLNVFHPFHLSGISPADCVRKGPNLYWSRERPPVYEVRVSRSGRTDALGGAEVPDGLREVAVLGQTAGGQGPASLKARRLARFLHGRCTYTLDDLHMPEGVSPIPWFVFEGKRGSCEHFASALAVMLRGCGIPARVVAGFYVHEFNTAGRYFLVRSRDAHAWVEYLDGTWHTLEAVPPEAAPARTEAGLIDALRFGWIRWVIRYSLDDQVRFAATVLSPSKKLEREVGLLLTVAAGAVCAVCILVLILRRIRTARSVHYTRVLDALRRKGLTLDRHAPHEEHLARVAVRFPELRGEFERYLSDYLSWRFGRGRADLPGRTRDLLRAIRALPDNF